MADEGRPGDRLSGVRAQGAAGTAMLITPQETFLSLDDAGQALGCDPETVRELAAAGQLPGTKVGRAWVFLASELAAYCRSRMAQECHGKWQSTNAAPSTGRTSRSADTGLANRLKQIRSKKRNAANAN